MGCGLCCANELLKLKRKIAVNARKVKFFKAVLFWVKNKIWYAQNYSYKFTEIYPKKKNLFFPVSAKNQSVKLKNDRRCKSTVSLPRFRNKEVVKLANVMG